MRCGVGDYTHRLATALADVQGNAVALLTSRACVPGPESCALEMFPIVKCWGAGDAWKVFRLLRRWRPDLVHIQYPTQGYRGGMLPNLVPLLARLAGAHVVQTWHEPIARRALLALVLRRLVSGPIVVVRPRYIDLLHPLLRRLVPQHRLKFIASTSSIPRSSLSHEQKDALRRRYLRGQTRLIVFFGFLYRHKGVDLVFDVADPSTDHVFIAGDTDHADFKAELQCRAESAPWTGKATLAGFMPTDDIADLLSVADAVVLPFRLGGGDWNTSIHGATTNGAYVITTSTTRHGYDAQTNVFYATVGSTQQMRSALALAPQPRADRSETASEWPEIASAHLRLYESERELSAALR